MNSPAINQKDFYKTGHKPQYPTNTIKIYSNFTPRKTRMSGVDGIVWFSLTAFIKDFIIKEFNETFFQRDKQEVVAAYKRRLNNALPGNNIDFSHIEALHDLGYLPVTIKSLPEGSFVKFGVPVLTITNELPEFYWLPNFLETVLSCELWPGCTSATMAFNYRLIFDSYAMQTVGNTAFSSTWQIHDFSMRGMFGRRAAAMSGAGHLLCSFGTDTIPAIDYLEEYYNADSDKEIVGGSVPATEHSVMCMGMKESELETFRRLIMEVYPTGFVSIVSDTWDFWKVVGKGGYLEQLRTLILARDGRVVIRPDSGDPIKIITGWKTIELADDADDMAVLMASKTHEAFKFKGKYYQALTSCTIVEGEIVDGKELREDEVAGAIQCLWNTFGGITNELGYKELDPHIGLIYGDSITLDRARAICQRLKDNGFASTNWVAGVGSFTYTYTTRDTHGFAMKATYGELAIPLDEEEAKELCGDLTGECYGIETREIFKDPITDDGTKKSAKGLLVVWKDDKGDYFMEDQVEDTTEAQGELVIVYQNGELLVDPTLAEIRARVSEKLESLLK